MMGVDGEDLKFKNFVNFEIMPSEIEVIVDYEFMLKSSNYFINK